MEQIIKKQLDSIYRKIKRETKADIKSVQLQIGKGYLGTIKDNNYDLLVFFIDKNGAYTNRSTVNKKTIKDSTLEVINEIKLAV